MTAIVAFKRNGKVFLAGDRMASSWYEQYLVNAPKVFEISNNIYCGYTTSFYMGQLLEHTFTPPARVEGLSDTKYLYTVLIPSIRKLFADNEFGKKKTDKDEEPELGTFILVYKTRIFIFQANSSMLEVDIAGIGCGGTDMVTSITTTLNTLDELNIIVDDLTVHKVIAQAYASCASRISGVSAQHDLIVIGED